MRVVQFTFFVVCAMFVSSSAWAQKDQDREGPVGIFESSREYDQFMGQAKRLAYGPEGTAELRAMIPILNDIVLQQPIGQTARRYNVSSRSSLDLLSDPKIRQEIELVDDQLKQLNSVNRKLQEQMGAELRNLDFSDAEKMAQRIRRMQEQMTQRLEDVLLPHQLLRLKQLRFRMLLTRRSFVEVMTSEPFRSELEISGDQAEELHQATDEINDEIRKKILKLQEEGRKKLISRLKPEQARKVNELLGDDFHFSPNEDKRGKERRKKRVKEIREKEAKGQ